VTKTCSFSASASSACSFFLLRPPGLPDCPLLETGVQRRAAGAHLVIVLVVRHMRLPLRWRSGYVDYRNARRRVAIGSFLTQTAGIDNMVNCDNSTYDAMMKTRGRVMSRLSLPAGSLRGRPASLRTVPDCAGGPLRKQLIWRALLVMRSAISGVEPIFLPALREPGHGGGRGRTVWLPSAGWLAAIPRLPSLATHVRAAQTAVRA
jgi:hypothetical protein